MWTVWMCGMKRISGTYVKRPGWYFRIRTTRSSVRWSKKMSDLDRKTWEYRPRRFGRELKRVSKAVGMWEYRKNSPNKLSGGQKQRVAIAGVVAMHPKCIVLDEPTAMLDPNGRKEVIRAGACVKSGRKSNCHFDHALYGRSYLCR